ncbi:MAG: hypothetical protein GXP29_03975 [Planctomycetes bacterium]|nr:hypothetical protein [Planctomycetota bacterium]
MAKKARRSRQESKSRDRVGSSWLSRKVILPVVALCVVHFVLAVSSVANKSNTYDEIAHLTRGYSYFKTGDFRLAPPHPPLAHAWAALPGLGTDVKFSRGWMDSDSWYTSDVWQIGRAFFYYAKSGNAATIDSLLWRGRAMIALLSVALAVLVYFASARLFGTRGGLISLTLYAFSPTMLAHARLVTTDCAAALFFACSLAAIWWMLHRVSIASVVCSALSLTGLFLAKMSAVLIIPVGVVMLVVRLMSNVPLPVRIAKRRWELSSASARVGAFGSVLLIWIVVVWTGIWAAYGFRYDSMLSAEPGRDRYYSPNGVPNGQDVWQWQLRSLDDLKPTIAFLREHRLFPEAYIYSAVMSAQTARGRLAFLNGEVSIAGHRWFFPYAFLVKTPLPLLGLILLVCTIPFARGRLASRQSGSQPHEELSGGLKSWVYRTTPLWAFFIVYWLASLRTHLNIGHRHILPIYPIMFVMCGATVIYLRVGIRWMRACVYSLVAMFAAVSIWTFPNYLAFFNQIAGGPKQGYKHLVDSSLDWGQDLPGVKRFIEKRKSSGQNKPIYLSYFGSGGDRAVQHFGIEAITLPQRIDPKTSAVTAYRPGTYLISATNFQQVYQMHKGKSLSVWTDDLETEYQRTLAEAGNFLVEYADSAIGGDSVPATMRGTFKTCSSLAFARLCNYLREREPDHWIGNSILGYELSASDLGAAFK